jgi:HD-GYP domain-containing protein (c-di-GMP phosphodiesterase class II)
MTIDDEDPRVEALLREAPAREVEPLSRRDRVVEAGVALALVAMIAALALFVPGPQSSTPVMAVVLGVLHIVARRVRFSIGSGTTSPVLLAVVPMLVLLHPALAVATLTLCGLLSRADDFVTRRVHPDHAVLAFGDSMYAVGPALVLGLLGPAEPALSAWPVYALALLASLVSDNVVATVRCWLALGVPPELGLRLQVVTFSIDASLAPIGLAVALVGQHEPVAVLLVVPLIALLGALGREREQRLQQALHLSEAYRGSALLMGEMLEADDAYTGGEHSKGVLVLALDVGHELALDARAQRDLEFGALLHDIGKLRVPDAILNKPGKLDPAEWAIIKRHPVDGQEMLDRIGGALADVGLIVRGHHERWDGGGYPDGLVAEATPLAARIICACDAYSAMTTNRPYRGAMPIEDALAELRNCSGTQFDPQVVEAVERVVRREDRTPKISSLLAA